MTSSHAICLLAILACCSDKKLPSPTEAETTELRDVRKRLRSQDRFERGSAAFALAELCCNPMADEFHEGRANARPSACRTLASWARSETDPYVLGKAIGMLSPLCDMVPVEPLLAACERNCSRDTWGSLNEWLGTIEPTPTIVAVLSRQRRDVSARLALANFGEADLVPIVEALADPDAGTRTFAVSVFNFALSSAPLEMPEAIAALERASKDPDRDVAAFAEATAPDYWRAGREHPNAVVTRFVENGSLSLDEIALLGTRRFSCKAISAVPVLQHVASGSHLVKAAAARRALATRAKRCSK